MASTAPVEIPKPEQLRHGLSHPAVRDVLATEQVGDDGSCSRAVADRRPHVVGEGGCRLVPAGTAHRCGPGGSVDDGPHFGKVDDLAGIVSAIGGLGESLPHPPQHSGLWSTISSGLADI